MSVRDLKVWVLAASTGGVHAVPRFLSLVRCRSDMAFVYVQHLAEEQHPHLLQIVRRHCDWRVTGVNYGCALKGGAVLVPSADERFDIGDDGVLGVTDKDGWKPPYRPNIDDVAEQIGLFYREMAGIIIFTGMGKDGCRGSTLIHRHGGKVWVQRPDTCAAVSMPESVSQCLEPEFMGSVDELANEFNKRECAVPAGRAGGGKK